MSVETAQRVATIAERNLRRSKIIGESIYVTETDKTYLWDGDEWAEPEDFKLTGTVAVGAATDLLTRRGDYDGQHCIAAGESTALDGSAKSWRWVADNADAVDSGTIQVTGQAIGRWKAIVGTPADSSALNGVLAATLASMGGSAGRAVVLGGGSSLSDGAGGTFVLASTGSDTADNARYFTSAVGGYLWKRIVNDNCYQAAWFGVRPGVSDVGPALQAAIDATPASGKLKMPNGTVTMLTGVTISKVLTIDGNSCRVNFYGSGWAFTVSGVQVIVSNMGVYGAPNGVAVSLSDGGFKLTDSLSSTFTDVGCVYFTKSGAAAFELNGVVGGGWDGGGSYNNYKGFVFKRTASNPSNANKFFRVQARNGTSTVDGAFKCVHSGGLSGGNENLIEGCWIEDNAGPGIELDGALYWNIFDTRFEDNVGANVRISATGGSVSVGNHISGTYFSVAAPTNNAQIELLGSNTRYNEVGRCTFDNSGIPGLNSVYDTGTGNNILPSAMVSGTTRLAKFGFSNIDGALATIDLARIAFFQLGSGSGNGCLDRTIASGVVTIAETCSKYRIDTEGAAATDDLTTISGSTRPCARISLSIVANGRSVVVKHGTGNIRCGSDFTINSEFDRIELEYATAGGGQWVCVSKSDNA